MEIHGLGDALKKNRYEWEEKNKAVGFYRKNDFGLRETSFAIMVPMSTLNSWDQTFDKNMQPIIVPDKRGEGRKSDNGNG